MPDRREAVSILREEGLRQARGQDPARPTTVCRPADMAIAGRHDVVLMDIRMPRLNGLEATRRITGRAPRSPRVVILTTFDPYEYVFEALRAGASGFLVKTAPADQ